MCRTERQLIASLEDSESKNAFQKLRDLSPPIRKFSSISEFISNLHTTDGNSERHRSNDRLLSALVRALAGNQSDSVLQAILILAFIPALHRTSRDVFFLFPSLNEQDVCQQVLATFLRVSLSRSVQRRTGFVPIAIARTVRKIVFRWAFREVHVAEIQKEPGSGSPNFARPEPFDSYLLLRDFFEQCERTGVLAPSEQQMLTKLKLEGLSAKQLAQLQGTTSEEAIHHRSYRIMARLRKAASGLR
jgi:DNA-directed RNA polymerase specialized sigma24 family protein